MSLKKAQPIFLSEHSVVAPALNLPRAISKSESTAVTFKTQKQAEKYGLELCKAWIDKQL